MDIQNDTIDIEKEIDEIESSLTTLVDPDECGNTVLIALASCQSLIQTGNSEVIGNFYFILS